jgi:ion channel POLLUX/CASTOR
MQKPLTLRQKLRYRFDNLMARGAGAQMIMLAVMTALLLLVAAGAVAAFGVAPVDDDEGFFHLVWRSLIHAMDAGSIGEDKGSVAFLSIMLTVTLGGIFILSTLIGILNTSIGSLLDGLRKGKSVVAESRHTVILGYTEKVHTLLHELAEANANQRNACVVILSDRDKVAMDDEIRQRLGKKRMRVVTRSGSPLSLADLEIVNLPAAKAIIVTSPETAEDGEPMAPHEADTVVLKTLLAITKNPARGGGDYHIVAELQDKKMLDVARMVVGEKAVLLHAPPLISRLLVQTGRQSGLSVVFTELLDFGGSEIYIQPEPELAGKTFKQALGWYDDSCLIGVLTAEDQLLLPPPADRPMLVSDKIIAISEDDDTVIPNGAGAFIDEASIVARAPVIKRSPERTLVLGSNDRLTLVLRELAAYVMPGSETFIIGEDERVRERLTTVATQLKDMRVHFRAGDITDRDLLDTLDVTTFTHVLVLSESAGRSVEMADARTMVTLLHLRDICRRKGKSIPVTSEMLDIQNRELAAVAEADDFIVSNTLVALMVSQLAENRHLVKVFEQLFTPGGYEICMRPASHYVQQDKLIDFYTVVESAARRSEVAIGYRVPSLSREPGFGVFVNPKKSTKLQLGAQDQVIVLARGT